MRWFCRLAAIFAAAVLFAPQVAGAQGRLAEYLYYRQLGKQIGSAARNMAEYQAERQLWRDKIAGAKKALQECGGCSSAQAELDKWQRTENQFKAVAGTLAESVGMPPVVAKWLDIPMGLGVPYQPLPEAQIVVPSWAKERPDFCQAAVSEHLGCLKSYQDANRARGEKTTDWNSATFVGAQCFETSRQFRNCGKQDYDAFAREEGIARLRAEGHIVGQVVQEDAYTRVYYGRVSDSHVLEMPPEDVIRGALAEDGTVSLIFTMVRGRTGLLQRVEVARFHFSDAEPQGLPYRDGCFDLESRTRESEIKRRVCEDLAELWQRYDDPVLKCTYKPAGTGYAPPLVFWYAQRPEFVSLERLLSRDPNHYLAHRIGDPRLECPVTYEEAAGPVAQAYGVIKASAAARTRAVPETVKLPESEWLKERRLEAKRKADGERVAGFRGFPIAGTYFLGQHNQNRLIAHGSCEIGPSGESYQVTCKFGRTGQLTGVAAMAEEGLLVTWSSGRTITYQVSTGVNAVVNGTEVPPALLGFPSDYKDGGYYETLKRQNAAVVATAPQGGAVVGLAKCPLTMRSYRDATRPLNCVCAAVSTGSVYGTDLYTADSDLCRAALHAGAIKKAGDAITVALKPGAARYEGSTRNGVTTKAWKSFDSSFRFIVGAGSDAAAAQTSK